MKQADRVVLEEDQGARELQLVECSDIFSWGSIRFGEQAAQFRNEFATGARSPAFREHRRPHTSQNPRRTGNLAIRQNARGSGTQSLSAT
jgi:hypothetical protein